MRLRECKLHDIIMFTDHTNKTSVGTYVAESQYPNSPIGVMVTKTGKVEWFEGWMNVTVLVKA